MGAGFSLQENQFSLATEDRKIVFFHKKMFFFCNENSSQKNERGFLNSLFLQHPRTAHAQTPGMPPPSHRPDYDGLEGIRPLLRRPIPIAVITQLVFAKFHFRCCVYLFNRRTRKRAPPALPASHRRTNIPKRGKT